MGGLRSPVALHACTACATPCHVDVRCGCACGPRILAPPGQRSISVYKLKRADEMLVIVWHTALGARSFEPGGEGGGHHYRINARQVFPASVIIAHTRRFFSSYPPFPHLALHCTTAATAPPAARDNAAPPSSPRLCDSHVWVPLSHSCKPPDRQPVSATKEVLATGEFLVEVRGSQASVFHPREATLPVELLSHPCPRISFPQGVREYVSSL